MYVCLSCYEIFRTGREILRCPYCSSDHILYFMKEFGSIQELYQFEVMMEYLKGKERVFYLLDFCN